MDESEVYFYCECKDCGCEYFSVAVERDGDLKPRIVFCPECDSWRVQRQERSYSDGEFSGSRSFEIVEHGD